MLHDCSNARLRPTPMSHLQAEGVLEHGNAESVARWMSGGRNRPRCNSPTACSSIGVRFHLGQRVAAQDELEIIIESGVLQQGFGVFGNLVGGRHRFRSQETDRIGCHAGLGRLGEPVMRRHRRLRRQGRQNRCPGFYRRHRRACRLTEHDIDHSMHHSVYRCKSRQAWPRPGFRRCGNAS